MILVVIVISLRTALVQDVVAKKVTMEMENVVIVSSIDLSYNADSRCYTKLDWLWKNVEPIIFNVI